MVENLRETGTARGRIMNANLPECPAVRPDPKTCFVCLGPLPLNPVRLTQEFQHPEGLSTNLTMVWELCGRDCEVHLRAALQCLVEV